MDKELIISEDRNIVIYQSDINMIECEYIDSLMDAKMIYKSTVFNGLLNMIYDRYLKNIIKKDNKRIDFILCDSVFYNIYIPLCSKYDIVPTVIQFTSVLLRLSNDHITDIKNGIYRSNQTEVTNFNRQTIKKWYDMIESLMLGKALNENSIGCIFGLKSIYSYSDSNPIRVEIAQTEEHETPEQIAERHKTAFIPEKPDL